MVSQADNPNFLMMEPFTKWIQELYNNTTGLRVLKRKINNSKTGSYTMLNNIGKKKTEDPVTVVVKILKTGMSTVKFEIYDTVAKKRISFNADNDTFDFKHRILDEKTIKNLKNYEESPYDYDEVPEEPVMSGASSPAPSETNSSFSSRLVSSSRPSSSDSTPKASVTGSTEISEEEKSENQLLKEELERLSCENIILTIERDAILRSLAGARAKNGFSVSNLSIIRPLTTAGYGVKVFAVEDTHRKTTHSFKEVLFDRFSPPQKKLGFQLELDLLNKMNTFDKEQRSPHLLYLELMSEDLTPFRQSHYLIMEPATMGLAEFSTTYLKKDKNAVPIIIKQILRGISYLNNVFGRIHGNINIDSVVFNSVSEVQLTNFEYSYPLHTDMDPKKFLTGNNDFLSKHPFIFEQIERQRTIGVNWSADRWAVGCLFHKLLYESELFLNSKNYKDQPALIGTLKTKPHGELLFGFFDDYNNRVTTDHLLNSSFFASYQDRTVRSVFEEANQQNQQDQSQLNQPHLQQQAPSSSSYSGGDSSNPLGL